MHTAGKPVSDTYIDTADEEVGGGRGGGGGGGGRGSLSHSMVISFFSPHAVHTSRTVSANSYSYKLTSVMMGATVL